MSEVFFVFAHSKFLNVTIKKAFLRPSLMSPATANTDTVFLINFHIPT